MARKPNPKFMEPKKVSATLAKIVGNGPMPRTEVIKKLWVYIKKNNLQDTISVIGRDALKYTKIQGHPKARVEAIRTLFLREMLKTGTLTLGGHNLCYAHDEGDLNSILASYEHTLKIIAEELDTGKLEERLGIKPIEPLFKVRG